MAGSPLKRQRKLVARAVEGSVIAFPRLSHPRTGLSHAEWRALSPGEKLERLFGISLERMAEILAWPVAELEPPALALRGQVFHVFMIGAKALLDGSLGREAARERVIANLARDFRRGIPPVDS